MGFVESLEAVRAADGDALVDWSAAAAAATASTPRGELALDPATEAAYRDAVIEARDAVSATVGQPVELPETIEVIDRHHWIEQAAASFARMLDPAMPSVAHASLARTVNTGSAAFTLAILGRRVIGQYDPALFGTEDAAALYVVHPNVGVIADELDVEVGPFRRWVLHHEVAHAAEFCLATWLRPHLEEQLEAVLRALADGSFDRAALGELTRTMTAIEGFAELVMDESIDEDVSHLRDRLEDRRAGLGPLQQLVDWLLGITAKRQQYQRGREFFLAVADARGIDATLAVWRSPSNLPTESELTEPTRWIDRIDP